MKPAIHVTWSGTGKMEGVTSINDDPYSNEYCRSECPNREVCYAKFFCRIYKNVSHCFRKNGDLMSKGILPKHMLPRFMPGDVIRIHSYGELRNQTHLTNFRNMALDNDASRFVGWSHRAELFRRARMPENMRWIYSAAVDEIDPVIPAGFVGAFVPVSAECAEQEGIRITCNGQRCLSCGRCYGKKDPGVVYAKFKPVRVPA